MFALLREPPAPPRELSWRDRERALLAAHEYPDDYELDLPAERGVSTEPEENAWAEGLPAACGGWASSCRGRGGDRVPGEGDPRPGVSSEGRYTIVAE
jgi:hypothetical protein